MSTPRGNFRGFYHRLKNPIRVRGSFTLDAVPAAVDAQGRGFTVARTAAGRYTVTFNDAAAVMYSGRCSYQEAAGAGAVDMFGQLGAFAAGAAPTLVLRTMTAAVETDVPAGDRVFFDVVLYGEALDR
jgi:hypothetical protein